MSAQDAAVSQRLAQRLPRWLSQRLLPLSLPSPWHVRPGAARPALRTMLALCWALAMFAPALRAADQPPAVVGRIASTQGSLFHAPDARGDQWTGIGLNYPVAGGDNLWVDGDGHAEVDYGAGQFRIAGDTNLHVSRLDEGQLALFLAAGSLIVRVRVLEPGDAARVDTPLAQIDLARPGLYRIDVSPDRSRTTVVVREGEATIAAPAAVQQVLPGQTATLLAGESQADIGDGAGIDSFDAWSADRDRYYDRRGQDAYVSRQMVGQVDLDDYGSWRSYPDYGPVWFPTAVAADWAPYRYGMWTSLPGWGYTWVDATPWGYAPFHYGRWAFIGGRWGWCPGTYVARPTWAPAMVAWYGGGAWGYSATYEGPVWGWVPLGWGEPFMPWWRGCGSRCWSRYNHPYHVNLAERPRAPPTHYANWSVPGGLTAVPGAALASGQPVAINRIAIGSGAAFTPSLVASAPTIAPLPVTSAALRPGNPVPAPASTLLIRRKPLPRVPADRGRLAPATQQGAGIRMPAEAPFTPRPAPLYRMPAPAAMPLYRMPAPAVAPLYRVPAPAVAPRPVAPVFPGVPLQRAAPGPAPMPPAEVSVPVAPAPPAGVPMPAPPTRPN
ncbi:MAG: DUF6600 domain-containing protein [Casimicrobiaceae bacterium]